MDYVTSQIFWWLAFTLDLGMFATLPVYILIIITIWTNRKDEVLKNSFFKLMISVGIADIGMIINIFLTTRLALYGWVPHIFISLGGTVARLSSIFNYFFAFAQTCGVFVVAINRYTALRMPLKHQKIWRDGKVVIAAIVLLWIISFLTIIPLIIPAYYQFQISVQSDNKTVLLQWSRAIDGLYYNIPTTLVARVVLMIVTFGIYGIIFLGAYKNYRLGKITSVERAALNMSLVGFVHSIGMAIYLINFTANEISWFGYHYNLDDPNVSLFITNLGKNMFSAVNPYSLLYFSKSVREHFIEMYRLPLWQSKTPVVRIQEPSRTMAIDTHNEI